MVSFGEPDPIGSPNVPSHQQQQYTFTTTTTTTCQWTVNRDTAATAILSATTTILHRLQAILTPSTLSDRMRFISLSDRMRFISTEDCVAFCTTARPTGCVLFSFPTGCVLFLQQDCVALYHGSSDRMRFIFRQDAFYFPTGCVLFLHADCVVFVPRLSDRMCFILPRQDAFYFASANCVLFEASSQKHTTTTKTIYLFGASMSARQSRLDGKPFSVF